MRKRRTQSVQRNHTVKQVRTQDKKSVRQSMNNSDLGMVTVGLTGNEFEVKSMKSQVSG